MKKYNVVIVGGGSHRNPDLMAMLASKKDVFPLKRVVLYDNEAERQEIMGQYGEILMREYYPELEEFIYTTDPDVAFKDVDFALMQIRAGRLPMREKDEKIPLAHGCVGQETCGAGGFAYGLRSVPAIIELVKQIRKHSPEAWILNYSNPAAIVAEATKRIFPDDYRILNICDMPIAIMDAYAKLLGCQRKDFEPRYFGLNHFGWFTDLYGTDGKNYFDQLRTYLRDHEFKPYNAEQRSKSWLETYVRVNKYMQYLDEYVPTTYLQYYMFPDEIVKESDPNYTRADEAKDSREKDVFETCAKAVGRDTMDPSEMLTNSVFGNLMVEVAESIAYDLNNEFVVLVRNEGIIPNFESRAIIEVAGTIGKDGAKGYPYGDIDPYYKGLMEGQYAYEQLTVEAFREKSYTKALKALILNRSVIDPSKAGAVLDDLMEANKDYWYLT